MIKCEGSEDIVTREIKYVWPDMMEGLCEDCKTFVRLYEYYINNELVYKSGIHYKQSILKEV